MTFDTWSVRHAYEVIADTYAKKCVDELATNKFDRAVIDDTFAGHTSSGVVLDLGCGPGQVASYLADSGARMVALDLTPAMLAIAHQAHPALPLVAGDVMALPVRSGILDGIVAWYSLHNLQRAMLPSALSELRRALRTNGRLLIATHGGIGQEIVQHLWMGCPEQVVITYYQPEELSSVLAENGFYIEAVRQRAPVEHERQATKLYVVAVAE
jgi:ubiquinone/menaquinone biosynthesis C-methylase UbiE